ncbi:MAG: hypothetical protein GIW99_01345 [Candidatus Eremiobacteraeota bacterium]|nr:hypothetical protein [Candidatus Eremiobacteraeota bacterium]
MKRSGFMLAGLAAGLVGCAPAGPVQRFDVLNDSSEPLRSRFNAMKGKVRVLMLVSPT